MSSRFDTIPERDRQTDEQTDRDIVIISIARVSITVLTRDRISQTAGLSWLPIMNKRNNAPNIYT